LLEREFTTNRFHSEKCGGSIPFVCIDEFKKSR